MPKQLRHLITATSISFIITRYLSDFVIFQVSLFLLETYYAIQIHISITHLT